MRRAQRLIGPGVALCLGALVLVACTGARGPSNRSTSPVRLCRSVAGVVTSADATTVGRVRSLRFGIQSKPAPRLANSFKGAPDSRGAAWCWVQRHPRTYAVYAASAGYQPLLIGTISGAQRTPSGDPASVFH